MSRSCLAKALDLRSVTSPSLPKTSKLRLKDLVQFAVPVVDQPGRHDHQGALQFAPAGQFAQDQRRLDGLAQADLIGDQEAAGRRGGDAVRQHDLMRQQIDLRRGEGRGAVQERQGMGLVRQPRPPIATFSGSHVVDDLFRTSDRERERRDGYLPLAGAEEDAHEAVARCATPPRPRQIRVAHPLTGLEQKRLCQHS